MLLLILLALLIALIIIGMIGYHYLFGLDWVDAFYSATLILTTINSDVKPKNNAQKIFIAFYALFSVLVFLTLATALYGKIITLATVRY